MFYQVNIEKQTSLKIITESLENFGQKKPSRVVWFNLLEGPVRAGDLRVYPFRF